MIVEHQLEIRVRYNETDGQGRVHHAQYLNFFERGRVELMRSLGHSYRELEETGLMLVVTEMNVRYLGAAVFDDLLILTTGVVRAKGVRIEHRYEIVRPVSTTDADPLPSVTSTPIVKATSVIACVDRQGNVRRLPDYLRSS
jgi:acyl-CoA thioester hydrolase